MAGRSEEWRPMRLNAGKVLRGYEVSNRGRVRSYWAVGGSIRTLTAVPRQRRLVKHRGGFLVLGVQVKANKQQSWHVHELVARAFLGSRPSPFHVIIHRNGEFTDNRVSNLAWVTRSQAVQRSLKRAPRRPLAKLTERDVRAIRASPKTVKEMAKKHRVSVQTIYFIRKRITWKEVR